MAIKLVARTCTVLTENGAGLGMRLRFARNIILLHQVQFVCLDTTVNSISSTQQDVFCVLMLKPYKQPQADYIIAYNVPILQSDW